MSPRDAEFKKSRDEAGAGESADGMRSKELVLDVSRAKAGIRTEQKSSAARGKSKSRSSRRGKASK